jgi:tetratricopeptide (TPR) repeat protein
MLLTVLALVGTHGAWARADEATGPDDAKSTFQRGLEAFDRNRYPEALQFFERSYALSNKPEVLFDMAETHAAMGECQKAVDDLDRLVASNAVTRGLLSRAKARREELAPCGGEAGESSTTQEPKTSDTPPKVVGNDAPVFRPPPAALTLTPAAPTTPKRSRWQVTFLCTAGASAALFVSGVVLGVEARSSQNAVESSTAWNSQAMLEDQIGRTKGEAAVALLIASAAAAVVGVAAYVLWRR